MSGMPIINLICLVLWRIMSIVKSIDAEPPREARRIRFFSGIRLAFLFAFILSMSVTTAEISEIAAIYRINIILFVFTL